MNALLLAAALFQANPAPQWEMLRETPDAEIYVDPGSVTRAGVRFEINTRIVYHEAQSTGMKIGMFRSVYDCADQTVAFLHVTSYGVDGGVLSDRDATGPLAQPRPVPQGTPYDAVLDRFCPASGQGGK